MINSEYDYTYAHIMRQPAAATNKYSAQADMDTQPFANSLESIDAVDKYSAECKEDPSKKQMMNTQDVKLMYVPPFVKSLETKDAVEKYSAECKEAPSKKQIINTQNFAPKDLQLFVDSLETITRLNRAKLERQQQVANSRKMVNCLDTLRTFVSPDKYARRFYSRGPSNSICHEEYYYMPYEGGSNTTYYNISKSSSKLTSKQESEESGAFLNHSHASHFYEHLNSDPIRKRSTVITYPKSKSMKSRLVSLIMKNGYLRQPEVPPVNKVLSSTLFGENMEESEIYERVLDDVVRLQYRKNPKNTKRCRKQKHCMKKRRSTNCPEYKFLNKALSMLSL